MPRNIDFNITIFVLHILELLIYLKLKIKNSFLRIIKTYDSTMIFGYILINRIQPLQLSEILNKFQDDISCALAMY